MAGSVPIAGRCPARRPLGRGCGPALVTLKAEIDCDGRRRRYRRRVNLTVKIAYDIYCRNTDPTLRIAVAPGARLPAQFKARDWKLMAKDTSLLHSDASRDIGLKGHGYFKVGSSPVDFNRN